ncbi:MAG: threonine-phosphate decarboxylase [Alphaproteobacteria bacterium HGW-Alphaproteobacteria-6]|nr:MAG: threonine-phosphate decarboxylase [Alphaproteobacteria bacterium HGW-Alphaproteobacteria-6]
MRDHGGDIDRAVARFGGAAADWIDLSTGINRQPYPLPALAAAAWTDLPTAAAMAALTAAAAAAYRAPGTAAILALAGAQAAIQMIPHLAPPGRARVISPTYNEHAAALAAAGWQVAPATGLAALEGADLAVVVNPNNPDGRCHAPDALIALCRRVGRLVVDESFADAVPDLSLCPRIAEAPGLVVLRSFGKFYGLAGLRLGFALSDGATIATLAQRAGPWPVSGAAIAVGTAALADRDWWQATVTRLAAEVARLDALAARAGWQLLGGTALFRLYRTPGAEAAQDRLARARIWTRRFPWSDDLLRLGLPGNQAEWARLEVALTGAGGG